MSAVKSTSIERCITLSIPFHDADPAGIVWHGRYFKYFELARCELLQAIDYSYRQMADSGYVWPVVDLQARFVRPLEFDQTIRVSARLDEWEYRLRISYVIYDENNTVVARGRTDQAPVDDATGEMLVGCPDIVLKRVKIALSKTAEINKNTTNKD